MKCPQCQVDGSKVTDSRECEKGRRRRRSCFSCGARWWTIEKECHDNGYVYFVQARATKLIKIGYSLAPQLRVKDLQCETEDHLTLLAYMRGSQTEERHLHKEFKKDRETGEWFRPSSELFAIISKARQEQTISSAVLG